MSEVTKPTNDTVLTVKQLYKSQYYAVNRERCLAVCKIYREEHKEEIAASKHENYLKNFEAIAEHRNTKMQCSCGGRYTKTNKAQHERTDKHIKSLETV